MVCSKCRIAGQVEYKICFGQPQAAINHPQLAVDNIVNGGRTVTAFGTLGTVVMLVPLTNYSVGYKVITDTWHRDCCMACPREQSTIRAIPRTFSSLAERQGK